MNQAFPKGGVLIFTLVAVFLLSIVGAVTYFKIGPNILPQPQQDVKPTSAFKNFTSQAQKISFKYPKEWYVKDEYPFILISNFESSLHKNFQLTNDQIEILISKFSRCFPTLEEDLISPGCGEGGEKSKNQMLSKKTREAGSSIFYEYMIKTSIGEVHTFYFVQKDDRILQIEKHPDPSQFEKEFEEIVNSIQFL